MFKRFHSTTMPLGYALEEDAPDVSTSMGAASTFLTFWHCAAGNKPQVKPPTTKSRCSTELLRVKIWIRYPSNLGWRSLEYCCNDARLAMFFKIYHSLVAVPIPSYFEYPSRFTRNMH